MEEVMDSPGPDVAEVHGILLAMQKNLECPICLEIMKAPVSAQCAHVFCSFCILKLLEQKKGITKCPLCNGNISKSTLREDVRFKLVIERVLEAIGALECDMGLNRDQGPHKNAAVLQEKQIIVESKGYRGRLNGVKKVEKKNSALQRKSSRLLRPNRTVTRRSLIKESSCDKTVSCEIGSDSSEDVFQKTSTVRCVGRRSSSRSLNGERRAGKRRRSSSHVELQEPNDEDMVLLGTPDACGLLEARPGGPDTSPGNGDATKENMAVEKRQEVSFPVPCPGRPRGLSVSSFPQEGSSCSLPSMERSQLAMEAADPAPNKQAGNKAGLASVVQPAGMAHVRDGICPDKQELQQSQASHESPLSQVSGKNLSRSIQKVHEWLSKSEILPSTVLQEVNAEEGDPDLNPFMSDVDCHIFQETKLREDQQERATGGEVGRPVSKPVASRMVDKIFGRTYVRTRKSIRICSERETSHIPAEKSCTVVNTKSCDTPIRKNPAHRKATLELTPEDVVEKRTGIEVSEWADGNANGVLEGDGHSFVVVDAASGAEHRPAELPIEKGAPHFELDASPVGCHLYNLRNLKEARNSLSKRSQRLDKPACPLWLAKQGSTGSPEKTQAQTDGIPGSEGSRAASSDQTPIRRSKRFRPWAEGEQRESEPANKRRKQLGECVKKQKETQGGNASPLVAEGGPRALQCRPMSMTGDASKACGFPDGRGGSLSVEHPTERYSPRHIVPDATCQGSCLLLQCHFAEGEQSDLKVKEFTEIPQAEQSAVHDQAPEGNGFCLQDVKESCKSPKVGDKAIGNGELNPETDDSEPDAGFTGKIFHCCKRQSFLLHSSPSKKSAAGTPPALSIGLVEGSEGHYANESAPGLGNISEVGREPISSSGSEHIQVASPAVFQNSSCMPVIVKEAKSGNPLQNPKPASGKKESSEMEKTSDANNCSCGSSGLWRKDNLQGTSLHTADERSSGTTQFLEMRPESDRNKALACSFCSDLVQPPPVACQLQSSQSRRGHVADGSGVKEQRQLNSTGQQSAPMSSTGVLEGHSEPTPKNETPGFTLLSDTPEGLLGPASKSSLNPWEVDHQDALAMFAKTKQDSPLEKECSSSSSSGSRPESLAQARRRQAQKLSSSEEEDSSEDEELPCFQALLFGRSASTPSQPMKEEKEEEAEIPIQGSSSRSSPKSQDEGGSPSQESEGSVNLFSSQSHASGDSNIKPCDARLLTPLPTSQEKLAIPKTAPEPQSEISRDAGRLWDGHQGGEALGYDSEVSHLGDSSGFSSQSEILTTQQKDAMQNNLKKLQQEMAVIEAALKEGGQDAATDGLPLPGEEGVLTGGQTNSARGSMLRLRCGSRQSLLTTSPPAGSTPRTPNDRSRSSSASQEHISCYLATELEKGSSVAIQNISSAPEHESPGRPVSSFAATTISSSRKRNSNSLYSTSKRSMSLVGSGLFPDELRLVQKFARKTKSTWSTTISKDTTHVIMKTDEDLVCERTLKYFLGIAARKWVVSYQWVLQSLKEGSILNEGDFEVRGDIINGRNHQGPKRARESPTGKLFQGLEICCYGPFTDMKREQLEWMVELCGASLVKELHLFSCSTNPTEAVVVIQPDAWEEDSDCPGIPAHCTATVVAREWVLDSVACYQRMALDDYIVQQA